METTTMGSTGNGVILGYTGLYAPHCYIGVTVPQQWRITWKTQWKMKWTLGLHRDYMGVTLLGLYWGSWENGKENGTTI